MPILSLNRRQEKRDSDREGASNPWKEIEGTVRKVDEEKVKDCTEDIDTLLVFAGLYSAVLTAFLIESYKNLFADESEILLRQMVLQSSSYKFTNGYLNSTFDPSQLPTFKAAVSDIRVNVCWFASLILSLSSASFGIAVKQWLREFLAMDYISPQERLRIRDTRIHGLADWKLFQIAAFLPILLQISLMLFFVGLCFFTAAVHRSIGITSLFLVSCWAFLFFMSVFAPLFSPRCPYKTTILKVPFRHARPHVRAFLLLVYCRIATLHAHLHSTRLAANEQTGNISDDSHVSRPAARRTVWLRLRAVFANTIGASRVRATSVARALNRDSEAAMNIPSGSAHSQPPVSPEVSHEQLPTTSGQAVAVATGYTDMQDNLARSIRSQLSSISAYYLRYLRGETLENITSAEPADIDFEDAQSSSKELQYYDDYMDLGILSKLSPYVVDEETVTEEEDTIRRTDGNDLIILWNIDVAFFDDSLLASMPQALSQPLALLDVLRFVTTVVWHRLGSSIESATALEKPRRREWLWTLSPRARVALVNMLVESMEYELLRVTSVDWTKFSRMDSEWSRSFTLLISLLPSRPTTPNSIIRLFEGLAAYYLKHDVDENPYDIFSYQVRMLARSDPDWPARSLLFLARGITTLKIEDAEDCVRQIVQAIFVKPGPPSDDTYRVLLTRKPLDEYDGGDVIVPTPQTMVALLEVARVILQNVTLDETHSQGSFPVKTSLLLEFVFDAIPRVNSLPGADFDKPLAEPSDGSGLYRVLADLFTSPHTTRPLLHFFATHARFLAPPSRSESEWFFFGLIERAPLSRGSCIMVVAACVEFLMAQATSTSSASFIVDSPSTLLRLCLLIYWFPTHADDELTAYWKKLFTVIDACYKRIIQPKPHSEPSTVVCRYIGSDEEHTDTCKTAYTILVRGDVWALDYKFPDEAINFLRTFVCPSHTFDRYGRKLDLIKRLEDAEAAAEGTAVSKEPPSSFVEELKTGLEEAGSRISHLTDGTPILPTPSADGWRQSAGLVQYPVSTDAVVMEAAPLGVTVSLTPQSLFQGAALGSHSGIHDSEDHATELPRLADLEHTTGTELQTHHGTETIDGASESHSVSVPSSPLSQPSAIREDLSSVLLADAPDDIQAVDSQATVFSAPPTDTGHGPASTAGPGASGLRLSAVAPLFEDGAIDGDAPKLRNEGASHTSRSVVHTDRKDEVTSLSDIVNSGDRDVLGPSEGISG